jgi:O-antigen/teichoic acid export membrane protein
MSDRLRSPRPSNEDLPADGPAPGSEPAGPPQGTARRLLRQSTLLLVGRILSKLANFATQVLIVRYLSQSAYGGFAYALSVATVLQNVVALGLDRSIVRFLPIYQARRDTARLYGVIAMAVIVIVSMGLLAAAVLYGFQSAFGHYVPNRATTLPLLLILVFLAPLQSLDDLLVGMFAVFAKARSIFVRRFLLAPVLRLAVAAAMVAGKGDVLLLATGYVASGLFGVILYSFLLVRVLRQEGLLEPMPIRELRLPWKEVLGFTLPLLTTDLTYAAMTTWSILLLGHQWGTAGVASLTAVLPTARMNELVMNTFGILYVPLAARMFAERDRLGVNDLYWRTAIWIAILTFPVFALTFSLAEPLTVLLFGARYASSAPILAVLALGYYVNAATGLNGLTLKVFGKVRALVLLNVATILCSILLSLILVPRWGAFGAAAGITVSLFVHNGLKQLGLKLGTGVRLFAPEYFRVYAWIVSCALGLFALDWFVSPPIAVTLAVGALASWLLVRVSAGMLELETTFPEALRWPGMKLLLPRSRGHAATSVEPNDAPATSALRREARG